MRKGKVERKCMRKGKVERKCRGAYEERKGRKEM